MKLTLKSLVFTALLSLPFSAHALKGDTDQPINIDSNSQSLDLESNVVTFAGNVVITQGSIKILAEKVTITRPQTAGQKEKIDAEGAPVKFSQTLDNGKPVEGQASKVHYDLGKEFLTLTGNARLKQQDSSISGANISYDVKKQQLRATSGAKSRVKTVLIPNQLQQNKK